MVIDWCVIGRGYGQGIGRGICYEVIAPSKVGFSIPAQPEIDGQTGKVDEFAIVNIRSFIGKVILRIVQAGIRKVDITKDYRTCRGDDDDAPWGVVDDRALLGAVEALLDGGGGFVAEDGDDLLEFAAGGGGLGLPEGDVGGRCALVTGEGGEGQGEGQEKNKGRGKQLFQGMTPFRMECVYFKKILTQFKPRCNMECEMTVREGRGNVRGGVAGGDDAKRRD